MYEGITLLRLRKSSTAYEGITYEGITPLRLRKSSTAPFALAARVSIAYKGTTHVDYTNKKR